MVYWDMELFPVFLAFCLVNIQEKARFLVEMKHHAPQ